MTVPDIITITLWSIAIGTLAQGSIHFRTAWILWHQHSLTELGPAVNQRELSLGIKSVALALAIIWSTGPSERSLPSLLLLSIVIWVVVGYGVIFLRTLDRERAMPTLSVGTEAEEMIKHTAATVDEVKTDVKTIKRRIDKE